MIWKICIGIACSFFSYALMVKHPFIFLACWSLLPFGIWSSYSNKHYPFREDDGQNELKKFLLNLIIGCLVITAALGYLTFFGSSDPKCHTRYC